MFTAETSNKTIALNDTKIFDKERFRAVAL